MKYWIIKKSEWVRTMHIKGMREIKLYDNDLQFVGIGLY